MLSKSTYNTGPIHLYFKYFVNKKFSNFACESHIAGPAAIKFAITELGVLYRCPDSKTDNVFLMCTPKLVRRPKSGHTRHYPIHSTRRGCFWFCRTTIYFLGLNETLKNKHYAELYVTAILSRRRQRQPDKCT